METYVMHNYDGGGWLAWAPTFSRRLVQREHMLGATLFAEGVTGCFRARCPSKKGNRREE